MMALRSLFISDATRSLCLIAFCLMFAATAGAANSIISYTTSDGSVAAPQGLFSDVSDNRLSITSSSKTTLQFDGEVTHIGSYAFHNCSALTSLTLPNSVTSVGYFAFSNCPRLNKPIYNTAIFARLPESHNSAFDIPTGIREIASAAFRNCASLPSVTIPASVKTIDESAFAYCTKLTAITLPNSITRIDEHAFDGCSNLTTIHAGAVPAQIAATTFSGVNKSKCVLYVPQGASALYKSIDHWKDFQNIKEYTSTESDDIEYADEMIFADGESYTGDTKTYVSLFSYSRKFTGTNWGTLVLPVSLDYDDWADNFEIADITGVSVTLTSAGALSTFTMQQKVLGKGESTTPNRPYLIRAKVPNSTTAQTISKKNCIVYPAEDKPTEYVVSNYAFKFKGTYTRIAAPNLYGKYIISSGKWIAAKTTSSMSPMRVYLEVEKAQQTSSTKSEEPSYTAVMKFSDGDEYTGETTVNASLFSYSRIFKVTTWGTIILPVSLSYSDWSSKFEIAEISDVDVTLSGGKISSFTVKRRVLGKNDVTVPNRPYMIRAKTANSKTAQTISKKNCVVYPAEPEDVEITKGNYTFVFRGTYTRIAAPDLYGYYIASSGNWIAAKTTSSMGPMRDYLEIVGSSSAKARSFNDETDIDAIEEDGETPQQEPVKVSSRIIGLAPGTYNINGRRVIVTR